MKYISLESFYDTGADILFHVEKMFYRYKIAMKNDLNDVVVALVVVDDKSHEWGWKIAQYEDERRTIFPEVTNNWKAWCGSDVLFAVTRSYRVNFE